MWCIHSGSRFEIGSQCQSRYECTKNSIFFSSFFVHPFLNHSRWATNLANKKVFTIQNVIELESFFLFVVLFPALHFALPNRSNGLCMRHRAKTTLTNIQSGQPVTAYHFSTILSFQTSKFWIASGLEYLELVENLLFWFDFLRKFVCLSCLKCLPSLARVPLKPPFQKSYVSSERPRVNFDKKEGTKSKERRSWTK